MWGLVRENAFFIVMVVLIVVAWLALRTTATEFESNSSFDALLARGEPVVVEFFGNT